MAPRRLQTSFRAPIFLPVGTATSTGRNTVGLVGWTTPRACPDGTYIGKPKIDRRNQKEIGPGPLSETLHKNDDRGPGGEQRSDDRAGESQQICDKRISGAVAGQAFGRGPTRHAQENEHSNCIEREIGLFLRTKEI